MKYKCFVNCSEMKGEKHIFSLIKQNQITKKNKENKLLMF